MEQTITGINEIIYPHLHVWNWLVAVYLFLGGLAAGLLVMSAVANLRTWPDEQGSPHCVKGALYAPWILMLGMVFIFLDLERKSHVYWFFLTLQIFSPMSWGAWGISLTIPLSAHRTSVKLFLTKVDIWLICNRLQDESQRAHGPAGRIHHQAGIYLCGTAQLILSSLRYHHTRLIASCTTSISAGRAPK